ncbi:hypothetical protein NL676_037494 [Syzygium grande]|nr:hypothetical protein NL676_037494 [Syzygium grande]
MEGRWRTIQAFISVARAFTYLRDNAAAKVSMGSMTTVDMSVECGGLLERLCEGVRQFSFVGLFSIIFLTLEISSNKTCFTSSFASRKITPQKGTTDPKPGQNIKKPHRMHAYAGCGDDKDNKPCVAQDTKYVHDDKCAPGRRPRGRTSNGTP